ncbi:glucose-1-phosphate thymidylyltransferase RfbA [Candidatus Pelagibacter sp.]|nr:glucose-1-phosphate thymidylyltransferase RfbA [Candidatus Pelagibacter sp.]
MNRVGIILAGGYGTRLRPVTNAISKHLIPIHDKPMIFYPLSILMLMKIKKIFIVVTDNDYKQYEKLLGNGSNYGISIKYIFQEKPLGIADGLFKCKEFVKKNRICLILGDNIFYGSNLKLNFSNISNSKKNTIIGYRVSKPENYGVINFNKKGKLTSIVEKPKNPKSNYVVPGIYFYENNVFDYLKKIKPSKRNELEITDLNNLLIKNKKLNCKIFGRGYAWLDAGTFDDLLETSRMISTIESRQNLKIGCLEEIALNNKWINRNQILKNINNLKDTSYGKYLQELIR